MSTLLYSWGAVPRDEASVRSSVTVVNEDAPSSTADHAPDFNETLTDPNTDGGLTLHQIGSYVTPRRKAPPDFRSNDEHNEIVNRKISTGGTAAEREAAGEWGHGTLFIQEAIEPTIRDGGAFGETFFASGRHDVQKGMGHYMTPTPVPDSQSLQATGNSNARDAANPYNSFLDEMLGRKK